MNFLHITLNINCVSLRKVGDWLYESEVVRMFYLPLQPVPRFLMRKRRKTLKKKKSFCLGQEARNNIHF